VDISSLERAYKNGATSPTDVVREIYAQIGANSLRPVWITLVDEEQNLARAKQLESSKEKESLPSLRHPLCGQR
jgi:Asp-tRNA(Asn)/Glu-tRNA(Gln) amidotransferase A subunit family amidase